MKTENANSGRNLNIWKILCYKTNKQRGPIKEIRIIEFLLCVICLLLILLKHLYFAVHLEVYVVIISPIVLYMIITFIDFMFIYTWWPTGWLSFSITGSLFFFACVGLSFHIDDALAYIALFTITAIVFLLDALCTLKQIRNVIPSVTPSPGYMKTPAHYSGEQKLKSRGEYSFEHITTGQGSRLSDGHYENERKDIHSSGRNATSSDERQDSRSSKRETNTTDEEKSTSSGEETNNERRRSKKIRNRRSEMILARTKVSRYAKNLQARRSIRRMQAKREAFKKVAPSYGGTFHVSRDTVPMACPFVNLQDEPQNENDEEQDWKNDSRKCNKIVESTMLRNSDGVVLTPLRLPQSATKYRSSPRQNQNDFRSTSAIN